MLAKKFALGFGIAIIFPMMLHYGVTTFSPEPNWKDYQVKNYYSRHKDAAPAQRRQLEVEKNRLDDQRELAEKQFQSHLFMVAVPVGLATIIIGTFLAVESVGTGLMLGGIFSICDGYINYWPRLSDGLRFVSLLVALLVLVTVGYKKLERKS